MTSENTRSHRMVGNAKKFWFWSAKEGWDLTHPVNHESKPFARGIRLNAETSNVTIDPAKTALLVIDMQNLFLSDALGEKPCAAVQAAEETINEIALPAARKLGIQVIWLNWGLTEQECEDLPPSVLRDSAFETNTTKKSQSLGTEDSLATPSGEFNNIGESPIARGPGVDLGEVTLHDGSKTPAGRVMMRGTWNTAVHDVLLSEFEAGQQATPPDVLIYKNRNSGLWNDRSTLNEHLETKGIRTLLFTGINTDQCVISTLIDAQARGFDTIFLEDGCATGSPGFAQETAVYNCRKCLGFLSSCQALARAADMATE